MRKRSNMVGMKFNRLTVIRQVKCNNKSKSSMWLCRCECGNECVVSRVNLRKGQKSCGCSRNGEHNITHGLSNTRIYKIWDAMKSRCRNTPLNKDNPYVMKGVEVCKEWSDNFLSFYEWSMSNGYKDGLTIDRIDNNKGYHPSNCRWVTMKEQQNNKSNNRILTIDGVSKTIAEWSDASGVPYETIRTRIRNGFSGADLITDKRLIKN